MPYADKWIRRIENLCATAAGVALFLMMLITVLDVALRYIFNSPLEWSFDVISKYLMVAAFFLILSYTLRIDAHVGINLIVRRLSIRSRRILNVAGNMLSFVFFSIVFVAGTTVTWEAWVAHERPIGAISWPIWTSYVFVPLGVVVLMARILYGVITVGDSLSDEVE